MCLAYLEPLLIWRFGEEVTEYSKSLSTPVLVLLIHHLLCLFETSGGSVAKELEQSLHLTGSAVIET